MNETYIHAWDDFHKATHRPSQGFMIGTVNGKRVRFTIRQSSKSSEMPTNYPVYSTAYYLGCLDGDDDIDYSHTGGCKYSC